MLQSINLTLIVLGFATTLYTTYIYIKLVKSLTKESYTFREIYIEQRIVVTFLFIFLIGFVVGFIDVMARDVDPIFTFILVIFFLGSLFLLLVFKSYDSLIKILFQKNTEILKTIVNMIEFKDKYTKGHSEHVRDIVSLFYDTLPEDYQRRINRRQLLDAALLHDCGKIGVRDEVLNKLGKLDHDEWENVKTHASNGKILLSTTCFRELSDWVLCHHERMDGNGYHGRPGNEIPLAARIIAIADTYSALCTNRVYRARVAHDQAIRILQEAAGTQLDHELVRLFVQIDPAELEQVSPAPLTDHSDRGRMRRGRLSRLP